MTSTVKGTVSCNSLKQSPCESAKTLTPSQSSKRVRPEYVILDYDEKCISAENVQLGSHPEYEL